jgi:DNA polymerase alpha subunit B
VASGPFTTTDSLEYEPLDDLMSVIATKRPDVVVLAGPFVDANHPRYVSWRVTWPLH